MKPHVVFPGFHENRALGTVGAVDRGWPAIDKRLPSRIESICSSKYPGLSLWTATSNSAIFSERMRA